MLAVTKSGARIVWPNPPAPSATLVRELKGGKTRQRVLGPRALLTLDQAAEVLQRKKADVQRSIRGGFLRSVRRGGRRYVTLQACSDYVREVITDTTVARAREHDREIPAEEVFREAGV